jgi:hypothetical protein
LHARGASVLVAAGYAVNDFKARRKDMLDYLSGKYEALMDDEDGIAFALDRPR